MAVTPAESPPKAPESAASAGFGIYVHWPFCLSKCPYCDFNSHVRDRIDEARWRRALLAEIDHYADRSAGQVATSIFFGGGTPSLMAPETAAAVIDCVRERWPGSPELEITLEANPGAAEVDRFAAFRDAGVNRVSIGVQALDDDALRFLGRIHGRAEAVAAIDRAARIFPRFSFDLIYARPQQTVAGWLAELDTALALGPQHLSLYQLTIEPGTAFHTAVRLGQFDVPDGDHGAELFEATGDRMATAGLPAYEISNHARPGRECRHNLTYWRYGDYVGCGPGAHGRITANGGKLATRQKRLPEAWLTAVETEGHATDEVAALTKREQIEEMLMMGLRLNEGVGALRFREQVGADIGEVIDLEAKSGLAELGMLVSDDSGVRLTDAGRLRLDTILARLLA